MCRQAERRGTWRPATQTIGVDRHAFRVEVHAAFTLVAPQTVQEHTRRSQRLRLTGQHLWLRPVHAINLRLARRQLAKVFVLGAVFEALVEVVALDILSNIRVPALHQFAWKDFANHACAACLDERDLVAGDALFDDVGKLDLRNDVFSTIALRGDSLRLRTDRFLDFGEHLPVVRQSGAQRLFRLPDCARQIVND